MGLLKGSERRAPQFGRALQAGRARRPLPSAPLQSLRLEDVDGLPPLPDVDEDRVGGVSALIRVLDRRKLFVGQVGDDGGAVLGHERQYRSSPSSSPVTELMRGLPS